MQPVRIGLIGDRDPTVVAHRAIPLALRIAERRIGRELDVAWISTPSLSGDVPAYLSGFAGLWCVPASPYANTEGALAAIQFARQCGRPFLGTCGGFQHALLEYVRGVLGATGAQHAELCPDAPMPIIARLSCSLVEKSGVVRLREGSRLRTICGASEIEESYHCNYGLNPDYEKLLDGATLRVSGRDLAGEARAVELEGHAFFMATLFQPERAALAEMAHPLIDAFAAAAAAWADANRHSMPSAV